MACRNIDEKEVEQILLEGRINYAKSQQTGADPRYAIEGRTSDNQQVRIVYAATNSSIVVVTAIDLEMDWPCNCKD